MGEFYATAEETRSMTDNERIEYRILLGEEWVDDPDLPATQIVVFTDGSASARTRLGGWGAVLLHGTSLKELHGGYELTTNNAMELTAILRAVQHIGPGKSPIRIFSDSRYCVDALTSWHHDWRRRDWVTAGGLPVANVELIEAILNHPNWGRVGLLWVKGHDDHFYNEIADALAGRYKKHPDLPAPAEPDPRPDPSPAGARVAAWNAPAVEGAEPELGGDRLLPGGEGVRRTQGLRDALRGTGRCRERIRSGPVKKVLPSD